MTNLNYVSPFFIVTNLKTSVAFYADKPGFEVRYMGPDEAHYFAIVGRDHISIMLKEIAADIKPVPIIPGMDGLAGMHIFLLLNRMLYLRNTIQVG